MNNYQSTPRKKLATNRTFGTFFIRGLCSFAILAIFDMYMMSQDLRTITKKYTSKKPSSLFFSRKSAKIINAELERRGINFKPLSLSYFNYNYKSFIDALNVLSEDYNING